jgi:hypothetical protein
MTELFERGLQRRRVVDDEHAQRSAAPFDRQSIGRVRTQRLRIDACDRGRFALVAVARLAGDDAFQRQIYREIS